MALQLLSLRFLPVLVSLLAAQGQEAPDPKVQGLPQETGKKCSSSSLERLWAPPPASLIPVFTACRPGLKPRQTPEGCASWGACSLWETPGTGDTVWSGCTRCAVEGLNWVGWSGMGHALHQASLPVVHWRLQVL